MSPEKKRAMIKRDHPQLSISQQCRLVRLSRSAFYYAPVGIDADTLAMMKEIDRVFTKYPFFGSRQIAAYLHREGVVIGRHRVRRLMARMGLEAIYKRPRTSQPHPQHPVFPYLLRGMQIDRPNQVWCADITFVPVRNGFLYLVAIMDWASRKVLSWRLSNTLHADFCVDALNEAIAKYGPPEIMNTDQGSQFTGSAWITTLTEVGVRISMDGRRRYLDNIFIERLWPHLMDTDHIDAENLPCWMLDTNHNGMAFYASQVFFPKTSAWDNLQKSLKGQFEDSVWSHLAGTVSEPFALGDKKRIAVKVIDERGNELMATRSEEDAV